RSLVRDKCPIATSAGAQSIAPYSSNLNRLGQRCRSSRSPPKSWRQTKRLSTPTDTANARCRAAHRTILVRGPLRSDRDARHARSAERSAMTHLLPPAPTAAAGGDEPRLHQPGPIREPLRAVLNPPIVSKKYRSPLSRNTVNFT